MFARSAWGSTLSTNAINTTGGIVCASTADCDALLLTDKTTTPADTSNMLHQENDILYFQGETVPTITNPTASGIAGLNRLPILDGVNPEKIIGDGDILISGTNSMSLTTLTAMKYSLRQ